MKHYCVVVDDNNISYTVTKQAALTDHLVDNTDNSVVGPVVAEDMQQTECIRQLAETQYRLFLCLRTVLTQLIPLDLIYTVYHDSCTIMQLNVKT